MMFGTADVPKNIEASLSNPAVERASMAGWTLRVKDALSPGHWFVKVAICTSRIGHTSMTFPSPTGP